MRQITSHKVNGLNEAIDIKVMDEPGAGGASHRYCLYTPHDAFNEELNASLVMEIGFQNGDPKNGVNGFSNEAILAVVEDRLKSFQAGAFACRENALALTHIQEAMHWLHHRTRERMQRGVEGTQQK